MSGQSPRILLYPKWRGAMTPLQVVSDHDEVKKRYPEVYEVLEVFRAALTKLGWECRDLILEEVLT